MGGLGFLVGNLSQVVVYAPSASLAAGWYLRVFLPQQPLAVGDVVVLTIPGGTIEGEDAPLRLLKQVGAVGGDQVCWDDAAMSVCNGQGRAVYPYAPGMDRGPHVNECVVVAAHALALVGTHPRSYDSRYFGLVARRRVEFRVRPLWTWEAV